MDFSTLSPSRRQGFEGFLTVSQLQRLGCREVPRARGVYLVLRQSDQDPQFLEVNIGGHF